MTKESKMTKDQIVKVENRMDKGKNRLIFVSIIMTLLIFISFFVPLGFLPNKRGHAFSELQKELTLSQSIGLLPTLIFLLLMVFLFFVVVIRHTKYLKLKKDLKVKEKGTLTFETKIIRVVELLGDAEKEFDVFLEQNDTGLEKLNYLISEFPDLRDGDSIKITIT